MTDSYVNGYLRALDPHYFVDGQFYVPQGSTAATTSIQTANQLGEVNARLNAGVFGVDIAPINPETLEQIPKEHFDEMYRLAKLSNATVSMHGPILDLVGFTQQNRWEEQSRIQAERMAEYAMDRAHQLNPKGNTFMNIHINNGMVGEQWRAATEEEKKKYEGKKDPLGNPILNKEKFSVSAIKEVEGYVNRDTGEISGFKFDEKMHPIGENQFWTPEVRLHEINKNLWDNEQLRVSQLQREQYEIQKRVEELDRTIRPDILMERVKTNIATPQEKSALASYQQNRQSLEGYNEELNSHVSTALSDIFHKLQYIPKETPEQKKQVNNFIQSVQGHYKEYDSEIKKTAEKYRHSNSNEEKHQYHQQIFQLRDNQLKQLQNDLRKVGAAQRSGIEGEDEIEIPQVVVSSNDFAKVKTIETVSNVVYNAYKKHGEYTPTFTLENYQPGLTLGSSENLKAVIDDSRKKFAERLVKEKGLDKKYAQETAEKLIGVTWDVGHINFMKKYGFKDEDVLRETEKIAKDVKQLHITDNFGFSDAHMPPGMGDSPIEQQFKILKEKGFGFEKGRLIIEAGPFVGTFKENPHVYTLEHFNSPLYSSVYGPTWNDMGKRYGSYAMGFGNMLPDVHFREVYGSGFSSLPRELGGAVGGERDRFSGTPMQ